MAMHSVISTILFCLSISNSIAFNYPLIRDYLRWKNLKLILFVTCEREKSDSFHINETIDYFQSNDIWLNYYDISNENDTLDFNYDHFFVRWSYQYLVVVDLECNYAKYMLKEISKRKMFHFERSWLIFARNSKQIFNVLAKENINADADIATAVSVGENLFEYKIADVYNPSHERNGRFKMENVGTWSRTWSLRMRDRQTKFEKRKDFGGVTFLSVITNAASYFHKNIPSVPKNKTFFQHINSDENPHLDSLSRSMYRIFQLLAAMFNFKMAIRRAKIWGSVQSNGTWLGAIGLMNRSEVDICLSGLRWENDRYGAFDQTTHAYFSQISFIFRHPKTSNTHNVFLAPFDILVWWLILTVGVVFSLTAKQLFSFENKLNEMRRNVKKDASSFSNGFLMVFGMFFQQGYCGKSLLISSRILTTTTLMLSLCIYQFYGSFIVGSLLTEPPKTIKTVKGLLHSKLDVAVDEVPYVLDNFKRVKEESVIELFNKVMKSPNPFMSVYRGLSMVKKGSFAFNTDGSYSFTILKSMLTDKELCSLQEVTYMPVIPSGPGLQKKSPLREMTKIGIRRISETGLLAYHLKIWLGHFPKCTNSRIDVTSIDLSQFASALYVLIFGMQLSLWILIGEMVSGYFLNWKLMKSIKCKCNRQ